MSEHRPQLSPLLTYNLQACERDGLSDSELLLTL